MRKQLNLFGLLAVLAVIAYGSFTAGALSEGGPLLHFIAYFVLAAAFLVNFQDTEKGHIEAILASGLVAMIIELIQAPIPYRTFSLMDFGVSLAGSTVITLDHHLGLVTRFVELEDDLIERFLV
ncbi:MAG: VanZ family protein [Candidatus Nanohalobium sp.]